MSTLVYLQYFPKPFSRYPVVFLEVDKACVDVFPEQNFELD